MQFFQTRSAMIKLARILKMDSLKIPCNLFVELNNYFKQIYLHNIS